MPTSSINRLLKKKINEEDKTVSDRLSRIKELLLADRAALLAGDFSHLSTTSDAISELLNDLEKNSRLTNSESSALSEIRNLAGRNASLMSAGIEGIKEAKEKIEMIRRATSELHTYTSEGQVENVTPAPSKIEKRA